MERRRIPPSLVKGNVSYEYVSDGGALKRSLTCRIKLRHCNCRRCRHCATTFLFLSFPFLPLPRRSFRRPASTHPFLTYSLPLPSFPAFFRFRSSGKYNLPLPRLPLLPLQVNFQTPRGSGGDHFIPER